MYAFSSSGSRKYLHITVAGTFAAAIILLSVSGTDGLPFAWAFQIAAILAATVAVYLLANFSLREYRYEVTDSGLVTADDAPVYDLTITEILGRKMKVTCRIALRDIGSVEVMDRATLRRRMPELRATLPHKFRYDNDPFSPVACLITVPGEEALILIPPDPGMVEILTGAVNHFHGENTSL